MRILKSISMLLVISLALLSIPTIGMAEDGSTKTKLTFSEAIEIPGVVLVPGTYVFKTTGADKHMIQVWDSKESHVLATLLTRVDYLATPAEKTSATFDNGTNDAPKALKTFQVKNDSAVEELIY